MNLAELEQYFSRAATSTSGPPADLERVFKGSATLPADARLRIYNRAYYYRLLDALASVFARTQRALGEAEFERLGLSYLEQMPSEDRAIERIGRHFPEFLRAHGSRDLLALPALSDLATLEWARSCALLAADPSGVATTRDVDPEKFPDARLHFVPSLRSITITERALDLFAQGDAISVDPAAPNPSVPTHGAPNSEALRGVAVWRRRYSVVHAPLTSLEFDALRLAQTGAPVSRICALFVTGDEPADALSAFRVLADWFAREWIERHESSF